MALSHKDATIVMGMLARGDKNQDICAWFGENPARIVEVENGQAFGEVAAAPAGDLPPKGPPGVKGRRFLGYVREAITALEAGNQDKALKELRDGVARFEKHEA
jgi:hypothetical protein